MTHVEDDVYEEVRALSVAMFERWEHQVAIDNEYARRLPGLRTYYADWPLEVREKVSKGIHKAGPAVIFEKLYYFGYELHGDRFVYLRHMHLPEWTNEPYPDIIMENGELHVGNLPPCIFNHFYIYLVHFPSLKASQLRRSSLKRRRGEN